MAVLKSQDLLQSLQWGHDKIVMEVSMYPDIVAYLTGASSFNGAMTK